MSIKMVIYTYNLTAPIRFRFVRDAIGAVRLRKSMTDYSMVFPYRGQYERLVDLYGGNDREYKIITKRSYLD